MKNRVVVTGMGVVAPNATGISDFEQALRSGRSGIRFVEKLEALKFSCRIGGIPENSMEDADGLPSGNIRYAVTAALEAWRDAGLSQPRTD
nr:beta-ketoacyl synthase N-terminal-like domain-containing protein [Desulfobacteraceae bacterium]